MDVGALLAQAASDAVIYMCGPASLIDSVRSAAAAAGISGERVRFERFLANARPGLDKPLTVQLARSGKRVDVALTPDERTLAGLMCICVSRSHTESLTLDL
jgi:ferredoxin-NADP reductase